MEDKQLLNAMAQKLQQMAAQLAALYEETQRMQVQFTTTTRGIDSGAPATITGRMDGLKDHIGVARNASNGISAALIEYANGLGR